MSDPSVGSTIVAALLKGPGILPTDFDPPSETAFWQYGNVVASAYSAESHAHAGGLSASTASLHRSAAIPLPRKPINQPFYLKACFT